MKDATASATAMVVAKNIAVVAATPRISSFVPPEAAELTSILIEAYGFRGFLRRVRRSWFQFLFRYYERCTIPGLALHQALRKLNIERIVRASLAEGFEQVVVLGGGLDTLALRLHREFPGVDFLELDHQATQRVKKEVIVSRQLAMANLRLIPVDFSKRTLKDYLAKSTDYRQDKKTVFVSEGVLMYLSAEEVAAVFAAIRQQEGPGIRFIFTFMELDAQLKPAFRNSTWLVRLWLWMKKEPFRWGLSQANLQGFLAARGFGLKEVVAAESFRGCALQGDQFRSDVLAEGEILCVADRS